MNLETNNTSDNTISLYWKCQLIGWGTVSLYWAYNVYFRDNYGVPLTILNYILDVTFGIIPTIFYRKIAKDFNWNDLSIRQLVGRIVPAILLISIAFTLLMNLKWYSYWHFIAKDEMDFIPTLIHWNPIFITGLRMMSIWVLAYHLYHYYHKQIRTAKQNAELAIIAKQAQLDNLSAQLNPHFLFNSLNSIKSLVIENPTIARRAVDLLSDLLRTSLYGKDQKYISIANELSLVNDYVELEKVRFEERLDISINVEKELESALIPPLSIQLLVENAIKHGIDKKIEGGQIELLVKEESGFIHIKVKNPGTLKNNEASSGLGLKNLTDRLALQYNGAASFNLTESGKGSITATLLIPINTK